MTAAAQKLQDRASRALDMVVNKARSEQHATGRQNKDHAEGPQMDLDMVMKGVTIGWLAQAFGINHQTAKNKLRNCPPLRAHRNGFVYDIRVAVPYLIKPKFDIAQFLEQATASDLPPKLQREYWGAKQARLNYEEEAGHLWRSSKVMELYGRMFLLIKSKHQQWAAALENTIGMTDAQIAVLTKLVDDLEKELHEEVMKQMALSKHGSVLSELNELEGEERDAVSEYVEDEEEDEEALIASVV